MAQVSNEIADVSYNPIDEPLKSLSPLAMVKGLPVIDIMVSFMP